MSAPWQPGDVVAHRHLCGERVWGLLPVYVVADTPELSVTYLPGGAPMTYVPGPWPTESGEHPWHPAEHWSGHGVLMLQRPGDPYGVWAFWDGQGRDFRCWYLNIHEWSRDDTGCSIRDLELDVLVYPDGTTRVKDDEWVDVRVSEGRLSEADAVLARRVGAELVAMAQRGDTWWDHEWARWVPPASWTPPPRLPVGR